MKSILNKIVDVFSGIRVYYPLLFEDSVLKRSRIEMLTTFGSAFHDFQHHFFRQAGRNGKSGHKVFPLI